MHIMVEGFWLPVQFISQSGGLIYISQLNGFMGLDLRCVSVPSNVRILPVCHTWLWYCTLKYEVVNRIDQVNGLFL